jgi:glutamate racemase
MATPMTIRETKFKNLMAQYEDEADIIPLPCPGLMDFVERGDLDGEDLRKYLVELLFAFRQEKVDAVVLGCTHYPFVKDMIQKTLGGDVLVFDGGAGTAREMKRRLGGAGLLTTRTGQGNVEFRNSLKSREKLELCRKLFEIESS